MAQRLSSRSGSIAQKKSFLGRILSALTVAALSVTATLTIGLSPANAEDEKTLQEWFPNPELSAIIGQILDKGTTDEINANEFSVITSLVINNQNTNVQSFSDFAPLQ